MRINQVEKSLKHFLKRKVSVTQSVIVGFLIMGMGAFTNAQEILDDQFITEGIVVSGTGSNFLNKGSIFNDYSPILSAGASNLSGNGVVIETSVDTIENIGKIEGKTKVRYGVSTSTTLKTLGNGIAYDVGIDKEAGKAINKLDNFGIIQGIADIEANPGSNSSSKTFTLHTSGNGITLHQTESKSIGGGILEFGDLGNRGIIKGDMLYTTSESFPGDFTAELRGSGNGISVFSTINETKSVIGKIDNDGVITGNVAIKTNMSKDLRGSGNGISVYSAGTNDQDVFNMGSINNNGKIEGNADIDIKTFGTGGTTGMYAVGNGLSVYAASGTNTVKVDDIINNGKISGSASLKYDGSNKPGSFRGIGNGISIYNSTGMTGEINNGGTITGEYSESNSYLASKSGEYGSGIYTNGTIKKILNTGVIAGSDYAIYASKDGFLDNYGVLVGQREVKAKKEIKAGIEVFLNNDGTVASIINQASGTEIDGKTVINAELIGETDSYLAASENYENNIINGVGTSKGVLNIASGNSSNLENSIVNGYKTAVSLDESSTLIAKDSTFNGGGLDGKTPIIKGVGGNNTVSITGNSTVNGDILLSGDNNNLTLGNATNMNGDEIRAVGQNNTLNLGDITSEKTDDVLRIYGNINGFKDVNVNGNVTLYATSKITSSENGKINLEDGSNLKLRVNVADRDEQGYITGHALYNTGASLVNKSEVSLINEDGNNGVVTVAAGGVKQSEIIAMGTTDIQEIDHNSFETNSIIHEITKTADGKNLKVVTDKTLPPGVDPGKITESSYQFLNGIYKNIVISDQADLLEPTVTFGDGDKTEAEAHEGLSELLEKLLIGNLATVSSDVAKESMKRFNEVAIDNPFTPKASQLIVDGGAIYNNGDSDYDFPETSDFNGKVGTDYKILNGYAKLEYGHTDRTSFGAVYGGGSIDLENDFSSKLDGNLAYVGLYTKHKTNLWDLNLFAGTGYQYVDYKGTKITGNNYQTFKNDQEFTVDGYTIYVGARKAFQLGRGFIVEPKVKLTYTSLSQDAITETGDLAMNILAKETNYLEGELGVNLRKDFTFKSGVGRLRTGVNWNILLDDHLADTMDTKFVAGGDTFQLLVPEKDENRAKLELSYEFEKPTGWSYTLGATYGIGKIADDLTVRIGAGYKF